MAFSNITNLLSGTGVRQAYRSVAEDEQKPIEESSECHDDLQDLQQSIRRLRKKLALVSWTLGFVSVFAALVAWSATWTSSDRRVAGAEERHAPVPSSM